MAFSVKHKWTLRSFLFLIIQTLRIVQCVPVSSIYAGYNKPCNSSVSCNSRALLACIGSTCQCESPTNQRYVQDLNICISIVGGHCSMNPAPASSTNEGPADITRKCIANAACVLTGGNYTECRCNDGYIENAFGDCVPGIGQPCNYGPEECNPLGMVMCKNGQCACLDALQVYDEDTKRCVSPAGTHCKYESLQLGCVKNALCYPFYYWVPPRCLCKPGFIQTVDRKCVTVADNSESVAKKESDDL